MLDKLTVTKNKLTHAIDQLCENAWMFSVHPGRDFTRSRKLPFRKMISLMLAMEGRSLTNEMLAYFGCSADIASSSAFVQQRSKINTAAFSSLFDLFVKMSDSPKNYKGLRLIAADGSDIHIPTNPTHTESYFLGSNGQSPYNLLHLDAMYDLLQRTYLDADLCGAKAADERKTMCSMVDRSCIESALFIADRGYENYNLMAHIQEKGWFYLIRIKDVGSKNSMAASLDLPQTEQFDFSVNLALTTKASNETKALFALKNQYRYVSPSQNFDYLPKKNRKYEPPIFYNLPFRIVRFKITDVTYETVVTNLPSVDFPPEELCRLYNMRWGIETSFRELKYTIGLLHFHAKKVEHIYQEVFARLIMYNFAELITSSVVISKADTKYAYKANFSVAVHVCRQFLLGNVAPPNVKALIARYVSPIRPGRSRPRNLTAKHAVSFFYRVA